MVCLWYRLWRCGHNNSGGDFATYTVDVQSMGMPVGTTILNIDLRIFFEQNSSYNCEVFVQNVIPILFY